ncbi:MAG: hypothetical protein IPG58_17135 [Acidobacteria bacterium]|nr:hypothetical protein [Acidobacteriota bacterium]
MRRFDGRAKFAALAVLIFVNSTLVLRAQDDSIYRLPAGTKISLRMDAEINSRVASVNDTFLAYVTKPVKRRDVVVVPQEAVVEGRVTKVSPASGGSERTDRGGFRITQIRWINPPDRWGCDKAFSCGVIEYV